MRTCVEPLTPACEGLAGELTTALRAADVTVVDRGQATDSTPRLLAFATPDVRLLDAVRDLSDHGRRRLLAVAGTGDLLAPGETWRLLGHGAADLLVWQGDATAAVAAARLARWTEIDELVDSEEVSTKLVGRCPVWRDTLRRVVEIARWSTSAVLVTGESGTGKELVARLIHRLDPRPDKGDLVVLDCATVVPTLAGSEFFGHERGAFTGAVAARDGAFALANGGTLFLDEVGELPPPLQAELLRVIQEGTYKRVGGNTWQSTRFRLVCATNRDLAAAQRDGQFRADLYYRIAAATIHLPSLAQRRADILPLFRHFLAGYGAAVPVEVSAEVCRLLEARDFPGNVRDLRQLAHRVCTRHVGVGPITPGDLPEEERPGDIPDVPAAAQIDDVVRQAIASGATLAQIREAAADAAIRAALTECGGKVGAAARRLGVTERTLQLRRAGRRAAPAR